MELRGIASGASMNTIHRYRRFDGWDYSRGASFFITIATAPRRALFGRVRGGGVVLSALGRKVEAPSVSQCENEGPRPYGWRDGFLPHRPPASNRCHPPTEYGIIRGMKMLVVICALACAAASGAVMPQLPEPSHADTEVWTNVPCATLCECKM